MADEYLRLAYHGLRAKDKSFNATMKTDYDETIGIDKYYSAGYWQGNSEFNHQCILCSNGKKETATGRGYEPTVTVSTKKIDNKIDS